MTYSFPPSLHPLRDCLRTFGADVSAFKTDRQAAFMAQQLLGTRVKFPAKGKDMTETMLRIQESARVSIQLSTPQKEVVFKQGVNHPEAPMQKGFLGGAQKHGKKGRQTKHHAFDHQAVTSGVHIFCDGAAVPNPGVGGWGYAVYQDGRETFAGWGGDPQATNNQMELTALLNAIDRARALSENPTVIIWCDSQYCVRGVNEWMAGWKANGWQRGGPNADPKNRILLNAELWQAIDAALNVASGPKIVIRWVKGHHGIAGNERADELAERGRQGVTDLDGRNDLADPNDLDVRYRQIMEASN
ncbi:ribonuclease H family protein [Allorhizobium borbori]|uniref:ribonuclease H n=1 Tax=Allorhizobium borbori TaxID=485907 RepID=A0A7W6K1U5_9HYPH|nr:ribonuclease H [Allorhizobium borbori]MBB4103557.1 ribonuclease HI [Allorhizobium borbori]